MNQAQLFEPEEKSAGYSPASPRWYRGQQIPATYLEHQGMRTVQCPTLEWVMDEIMDALRGGPIRCQEVHLYTASPVRIDVVAKHVHLLVEIGLVRMDYRFDWPRDRGGSNPAVVELVEV